MTGTSKIDDHGVDVRAMRERWEKSKVYSENLGTELSGVPQDISAIFRCVPGTSW